MNVQLLQAWEDLATRQRSWRVLAKECRALPEWTPSWCIPWWRELGPGRLRAVAVTEDEALVALGLFCESRAPGPKVLTALGRGTAPAVGILARPGRTDAALAVVERALGTQPAVLVLAGTVDVAVLEAGADAHGFHVSSRPHPASRVVDLDELAAAAAAGPRPTGVQVVMGREPRQAGPGVDALTRALGFEPGPVTSRRRERAFLITVLDAFARAGDLVWPLISDDDRLLATSAWLVHGDRASLWLRWTAVGLDASQAEADLHHAIEALRQRGVRDVVLRNDQAVAAGRGTPLGDRTAMVTNRPGLRRLEPLAWKLVRSAG